MESWKLTWSRLIPLNAKEVNNLDSTIEGVYRISRREGEKIIVFYIGKGQIKSRLETHISGVDANTCITKAVNSSECFFRFAIITSERVRNGAEKKLFKVYHPVCNEIEPEGAEDIEVNLE